MTIATAESGKQTPVAVLKELNYEARSRALIREREEIRKNFSGLRGFRVPRTQRKIQHERLAVVGRELAGIEKVKHAIDMGYQPYAIPRNWYAGILDNIPRVGWEKDEREPDPFKKNSIRLYFSTPMPADAIGKLHDAKRSGMFDGFLVGAPDRKLFQERDEEPELRSMMVDPVLVGYVIHDSGQAWIDANGMHGGSFRVEGMQGFLIAHWDLAKDLEFSE